MDDNEQTASHVCVLVAMQKVKDFGFKFQPGPIYQIRSVAYLQNDWIVS